MPLSLAPRLPRFLLLTGLLLAGLGVSGCSGLFRTDAAVGPDLKPRLGTSISMPFGK